MKCTTYLKKPTFPPVYQAADCGLTVVCRDTIKNDAIWCHKQCASRPPGKNGVLLGVKELLMQV